MIVSGTDSHTRSGANPPSSRRSHDTRAGCSAKAYSQFIQNQSFPTFVSADEFSSANESSAGSSSSSEESELTDFSDSSIAEEEECFIRTSEEQRARAHDKARIKRELLGNRMMKNKEPRNDWEIRTRKKSVGTSEDNMDVDTETDDEAEDGSEEDEGLHGEDDEDDTAAARGSYVGIATGWSEDEESSFDADLFFAGLSDSDSGPEITIAHNEVEAATEEDVDIGPSALTHGIFEITEGWDGSVIFTNGLQDGQGLLDWDFEANAAQLLIEAHPMSESNSGSDVRMSGSEGDMGDSEDETDGLEEMESNDGDTTEEELVDDHGLPTARAMRLFRPPVPPLFSINPLSTMSPGPRVRDVLSNPSPRPLDILAGHEFSDDDDDAPEPPMSEISSVVLSASSDRGTPRFPVMGMFEALKNESLRRAVIDGSRRAVPSPFQRNGRRHPSESVSVRSISGSRDRSLSLSHASFVPSPTLFRLPNLSDEPALLTSPALPLPLAENICLDDVLDASILDSDPMDALSAHGQPYDTIGDPEASATDDGERHLQSLSRWDRIPMNTFRHTRETRPPSDSPGELAYGSIIRNSPFNGVWTSDRSHHQPSSSPSKKGKGKKKGSRNRADMVISPVIMPVRDSDHTSTGHTIGQTGHGPLHSKPRKDKESRRDKMLKRKTLMGTSIGRRHQQHHHAHSHHPNLKGRASGSIQRTGVFSGASVPPLNL
ncbi:hypothetical protein F5148DRAFT_974912 [Russula earlei]|uniref:Uncharacterized protein n=1 Tax=Russula earlei TaxID=71964 RepID=A0ACC0UIK0_9AGAM|nr:hypothetical protein F5148DRAFT_974912 [Russula earlei]